MGVIYEPTGRAREYAALAANLYAGCEHGCQYCYAPEALRRNRQEFHERVYPRNNVLKQLELDAKRIGGQPTYRVLLSFSTDPYQPCDEAHQLTRSAIRILHDNGIRVQILTKGGIRAIRDFDLLTDQDAFASTLTFTDEADSRRWEPQAALPADRYKALQEAHSHGIPTWVSLEPVVSVEQTLQIILDTHRYVDLYKVGMLNHHQLTRSIDWSVFHGLAVELLNRLGKQYYVKRDLCEHAGVPYREWPETACRFVPKTAVAQATLF